MKATERPSNKFFNTQRHKKPIVADSYDKWLKDEDPLIIGRIEDAAQYCAERKAAGLPFKKPKLGGFERRLFEETMDHIEVSIFICDEVIPSDAEFKEMNDRYE